MNGTAAPAVAAGRLVVAAGAVSLAPAAQHRRRRRTSTGQPAAAHHHNHAHHAATSRMKRLDGLACWRLDRSGLRGLAAHLLGSVTCAAACVAIKSAAVTVTLCL